MKRPRWTVFGAATLLSLAMIAGSAHAAPRLVPFHYSTIQSAVDASHRGDTVWVLSGEYRENVVVEVDNLSIRGICRGPGNRAIVDGGTAGDVFHVAAADFSIQCLVLRHGETGIHSGRGLSVSDVKIVGSGDDGIYIEPGDDFEIRNSEIVGSGSAGIYVDGGVNGLISNTIVRGADDNCYEFEDVNGLTFSGNQGLGCTDYALEAYGEGIEIRESVFKNNYGGVDVDCDNSVIEGNSIIDSANGGDGLYVEGSGNTIRDNEVSHCYYDCLGVYGDDVVIRDNVLSNANDDYCMELAGDDMVVVGNSCLGQNEYGLYLDGDNAEIRDNMFDGAQNDAIYVNGDFAELTRNTVRGGYDGIYVDGESASVEANEVSGATYDPIYVFGYDPRVVDNQVSMGYSDAIYVYCPHHSCGAAEIRGNSVNGGGSGDAYSGINVNSGPGTVVSGNTVRRVQSYGFELDCNECTISSNTAIENGGDEGDQGGFYIEGDDSTLNDNRALGNVGPGFRIRGSGNTLDGNEAKRNSLEGFRIDLGASGNVLNRNIARRNHAEGIDNKGDSTELTSNVSSNNRTDCTDDGSVATRVGNTCEDGSNFDVVGSID